MVSGDSGLKRAKAETATHSCGKPVDPKKNLYQALITVPGVGHAQAHRALRACGFFAQTRCALLAPKEAQLIEAFFKDNDHTTGAEYWRARRKHDEELTQLRSVKVQRRMKGLPARGQRTKTNAKTARRFKLRTKRVAAAKKLTAKERADMLKKKKKRAKLNR